MALPSFNLTKQAPFQGITDKSWTKYQEYPAQFRSILESLNWGEEISTDPVPHEEATQIRLSWYNLKRFVQRARDLDAHFEWKAAHIQCQVILQADRINAIVRWMCIPQQPNSTRNQGLERMSLNKPTRISPSQPVEAPSMANPGMQPPGFQSPQHFTDSLNPQSEYSKEMAATEERMRLLDEAGTAWRAEMDEAIQLQDSMLKEYRFWKKAYPDEARYQELLSMDTSERRAQLRADADHFIKDFDAKQEEIFSRLQPSPYKAMDLLSMTPEEALAYQKLKDQTK